MLVTQKVSIIETAEKKKDGATKYTKMNKIYFFWLDPPPYTPKIKKKDLQVKSNIQCPNNSYHEFVLIFKRTFYEYDKIFCEITLRSPMNGWMDTDEFSA